jgi:hypothetical protein
MKSGRILNNENHQQLKKIKWHCYDVCIVMKLKIII